MSGVAPLEPKSANAVSDKLGEVFDNSNIENNQNASNKLAFKLHSMIDENDESLLNMSDQILKDLDDSDLETL